jgi:RNA-binding protein YhbY
VAWWNGLSKLVIWIRSATHKYVNSKPTLKIGKEGISQHFMPALHEVLKQHELVKVKFSETTTEEMLDSIG